MTYEGALAWLERFYNFEMRPRPARFGLANIERLLRAAGSPHERWMAVHIAGTKGKGSTAAFAEAILRTHGFQTGLYTSPHLKRVEERCLVSGVPISPGDFAREIEAIRPHAEAIVAEGWEPSFFDVLTAAAFRHFAERGVGAAVVEVGIGGRLDSTNAVRPAVSVVTTLGLDHTEWLGDTIEKIASEKAGIIRPGVPVVSHPQEPAAWAIVEAAAREAGAPLERLGAEARIEEDEPGRARSRFVVETPDSRHEGLELAMLGAHQRWNAASAVRASEIFARRVEDRALDRTLVREALARVSLPGRIEVVRIRPAVVVDGAHNPISIRTLFETLRDAFPGGRLLLVFGCAADKDVEAIFREGAGRVDRWFLTKNPTPRAADPEALAALLRWVEGGGARAEVHPEPATALASALAAARPEDVVCATGSFILAGALRRRLVP